MLDLESAIKHCEKVAEVQEEAAKEWHENQVRKCELIPFAEMDYTHENNCKKCADEHRQLATWLKDYKRLLNTIEDIKLDIQEYREQCDDEPWSYYNEGKREAYADVLVLIEKHTSGKGDV